MRCRAFAGTKEQLRGTTASFLQKEPVRAQPCSAAIERAAAALEHRRHAVGSCRSAVAIVAGVELGALKREAVRGNWCLWPSESARGRFDFSTEQWRRPGACARGRPAEHVDAWIKALRR